MLHLFGGVTTFNIFVAHGPPTQDLLEESTGLSRRISLDDRVRCLLPARRRCHRLAFESDSVWGREHKAAKDMLVGAHSMELGYWFAWEHRLWYAPPAQGGLAGEVPRWAEPSRCQAYMHGPFLHGHMATPEDLRVCFQCEEIDGVQRLLCVKCRDDRVRCLHPGKVRCLPGFCPAKERADHGNDWGREFMQPRVQQVKDAIAACSAPLLLRVEDFSKEHPRPKAERILSELRVDTESPAAQLRQAMISPVTCGDGTSERHRLLEGIFGRCIAATIVQFKSAKKKWPERCGPATYMYEPGARMARARESSSQAVVRLHTCTRMRVREQMH